MVKAKKYVVTKKFQGIPKRDDFELVEETLPPLKDGEILVKAEWISVDPSLRLGNRTRIVPYDQYSFQVASVIETKNSDYPIGTRVVSQRGWCNYAIINPNIKGTEVTDIFYKLPEMQGLSPSLAVGAVGMPGASAYLGLLDICDPKAGETVVVSGAAGAVGTLVGQIAKIKGCRVIGIAGSDDKVQWLENKLGFDKAINYKTADISKALKEAAPNGIDCYFDNVGGEIISIVINQMNIGGQVSVCGAISSYNDDTSVIPKAVILQTSVLVQALRIEGFHIYAPKMFTRWDLAFKDLVKWIKSGQIVAVEDVTEGFENLYDSFVGMLSGKNYGKAVVKV